MRARLALAVACGLTTTTASAASLQVAPVLLDVPAAGSATTITLRNTDTQPITAQIRVYRWVQAGGEERLEPTGDVVASPPFVELRARQDYTVRVVRTVRRTVAGEEAYRLVIDELPRPQQRSGTVSLVLRHVVPVFFASRGTSPANLTWGVSTQGRRLVLNARNHGDARLRLSAVSIRDASGRVVGASKGLVGYALGQGTMSWPLPATGPLPRPGSRVSISGSGETGPFNAAARVQATP
ncbi:fimbria/pilus periplasmic chaperone [Bosea sp. CS1GBMeth4]|uniref:fimbrial biogenesis chaperone n=1 Tax=Bosea sp. CS1GBMeth4 TaxID=1892849 RepID=UPI0016460D66|nr:fimbria/pilus periplasmic chaperone [Bosea sp. CS1GBMeth4]